jgi:hypothetical protein
MERTKECSAYVANNFPHTSDPNKVLHSKSSHYNRKLEKCLVRISETSVVADTGLDRHSAVTLFDAFERSMLANVPFKGDCAMSGEKVDCEKVDQFIRDAMQQ